MSITRNTTWAIVLLASLAIGGLIGTVVAKVHGESRDAGRIEEKRQ